MVLVQPLINLGCLKSASAVWGFVKQLEDRKVGIGASQMGYTHYYSIDTKKISQTRWDRVCRILNTIVYEYGQEHGGISGFSAHSKPGKYSGMSFNGSRENGYEPFELRAEIGKQDPRGFCKTARKPYDSLVTAVLSILQLEFGQDVVKVGSDGDYPDWVAGVELASEVLGIRVPVPAGITRTSKRHLKIA
jgi:hypothetical protein